MQLPFSIIEMLRHKSGSDLRLPSDCERLSLDIESKTGVHLGATTLRRLLGFSADERTPHTSTLDIIAQYLGFAHWEALSHLECGANSGFDSVVGEVRTDDVEIGTTITVYYLPDRTVSMEYHGHHKFYVKHSENSKLLEGDYLEIDHFIPHYPLLIKHVWRDEKDLGAFTAGRTGGITSIEKHEW